MENINFISKVTERTFFKKFRKNHSFELKTKNCNYTLAIVSMSMNHSNKTLSFGARLLTCKSHNGLSDITSNYYTISFNSKKGIGAMIGVRNLD